MDSNWLVVLGLLSYLLVSTYSVYYEFAYQTLWLTGTIDLGLGLFRPAAAYAAVFLWVVGGFLRLEWLISWCCAVVGSRRPSTRVLGKRQTMQSDVHCAMGYLSGNPRDRSGRPRFCKYVHSNEGCVDGERPLADRVYHCSHLGKKCRKDPRRRPDVHLAVYDHFCGWLRVNVYLDTIKPYLLSMVFLFLDSIIVFSCSVAGWSMTRQLDFSLHGPTTLLAVAVVLWLGWHNMHMKIHNLAMRNRTIPEMNQLRQNAAGLGGRLWFAIQLVPTDEFVYARYHEGRNPWDLSVRRNLYQVFGGWDCLLPWRQSPRCVGYGVSRGISDFEMNDEFWRWVEEVRADPGSRAAGSRPTVVAPLDQHQEEGQLTSSVTAAGRLPAPPPASLWTSPPPPLPTSPEPTASPPEIPLPLSPTSSGTG
ncbi:hypothetical protein M406DRAFT_75235 [Cryphonectria parasitica EP155]|uniref:Palmitoyltransferase n=1 Tax=Cryphonectria parasitica (strain ATCC 38755 / EP155) TaxID=660469 RepID=A0A9P4Y0Q5_CRYP1|nr:uncharacterized protein M406DRAFT_75235 [Cryphonectria parasitica EP155]KAF3764010.1 hypothetical protein M406DRAFT_75235 [Cryphonectria parasitica EP155]